MTTALLLLLPACPNNDDAGGGGTGTTTGANTPPGEAGTQASSLLQNPLSAICRTLAGDFFVTSSGGKLLVSSDGAIFTVLDNTAFDVRGVHCDRNASVSTSVWFAGTDGNIFFYDGSLSAQVSNTAETLHDINGTTTDNVYAVGNGGTVLRWDGVNWNVETSSTTEHLLGVTAAGAGSVETYAVGANRTVIKRTGAGLWSPVTTLPVTVEADTTLNAIWRDGISGDIFVVGSAGTIMKGTSSGTSWFEQESGTSLNLLGIHGTSDSQVAVVGADGVILSYDGNSWTRMTNPTETTFRLTDILSLGSTGAYAVGADGTDSDATGAILFLGATGWSQLL